MAATLTPHDASILSSLFTNEPPQISILRTQPSILPSLQSIRKQEREAVAQLNSLQPSPENIHYAILQLDQLIADQPDYASGYNNRAQAKRLVDGDDMTKSTSASEAWSDLQMCAEIEESKSKEEQDLKVLGAAYTQRGVMLLATSKSIKSLQLLNDEVDYAGDDQRSLDNLPQEIRDWNAERMAQEAEWAFKMGAKAGDEAAKMMVVHLNPMRKLCGQMVREALRRDMEESGVFSDRKEIA